MNQQAINPSAKPQPLSLKQLNLRVAQTLTVPSLINVWVVAELSDLRQNGGHCYMELVEKNAATGSVEARIRGIIWSNSFARLSAKFMADTGSRLATGQKLMLCGSVNYHPSFGISFIITDIDTAYTMGEMERRRREIVARLKAEGVLDLNRSIEWPDVALRIAVISAQGAAGYGDFINQLYNSPSRLRFSVKLFPAVLQGDKTATTVIQALDSIAAQFSEWDCVVIIRGGGATSDLAAFDDYELANNVAQFPLPVIVGIGHERDITVLDYVANMRVKTPTAAAEWLIAHGEDALSSINALGTEIVRTATDAIAGANARLAYFEGLLPVAPAAALERAAGRINSWSVSLLGTGRSVIAPARTALSAKAEAISTAAFAATDRASKAIDAYTRLAHVLSPMATLRRGYSITRIDGRAINSPDDIPAGATIETTLAGGKIISKKI